MGWKSRAFISDVARSFPVLLNVPTIITFRVTCSSVGTWDSFPEDRAGEVRSLPLTSKYRF